MGSLGFQELLVIFAIALIIFGPRRLPEIGRTVGRAFGEFRRATNDLKSSLEDDIEAERGQSSRPSADVRSVPTEPSSKP